MAQFILWDKKGTVFILSAAFVSSQVSIFITLLFILSASTWKEKGGRYEWGKLPINKGTPRPRFSGRPTWNSSEIKLPYFSHFHWDHITSYFAGELVEIHPQKVRELARAREGKREASVPILLSLSRCHRKEKAARCLKIQKEYQFKKRISSSMDGDDPRDRYRERKRGRRRERER